MGCCCLGCWGVLRSGMLLPGLLRHPAQWHAAAWAAATAVCCTLRGCKQHGDPALPTMCLTPPTFSRPPPPPQIDRADGSAADLATQLASQMNLGAAGGLGDPRAPLRA